MIIFLSGFISLAQPLLDAFVHDHLGGDPAWINLTMAGLSLIIGSCLVGFVAIRGREVKIEHEKEDREGSRTRLLNEDLESILEDERED